MDRRIRWILAGFGVIIAGLGVWAILRVPASEGGGTTLVIIGAVAIFLSAVPVLPTKFSLKDGTVEFGASEVDEVLELLVNDVPQDTYEEITRIFGRESTSTRETEKAAENIKRDEVSFEEEVSRGLRRTFPDASISEDVDVETGARGRNPILDAVIELPAGKVAVEAKGRWSATTARLTKQRLDRVLTLPEYSEAVIVVPPGLRAQALHDAGGSRIHVISPGQLDELPTMLLKAAKVGPTP